jgi:uncharacterized cupin superfamily protein
MLYPLRIPDVFSYSWLVPGQALPANAYLFVSQGANVLIDPLPLDDPTHDEIAKLGGISRIIVITAERERTAKEVAARYGATILTSARHREPLASGMTAIVLPNQKRNGEFAVNIADRRTVLVGDALLGSPAGALTMHDAREYADPVKAALGLRRILRENPGTLLVGYGQPVFAGAYNALYELLYARAGAAVHRINVDELDFRDQRDERAEQPAQFSSLDAEVGFAIGARKLGYRVSTLEPGHRFCPLHSHAREEELFFVIDGEPSVRTLSGTIRCRKGDFIALPVGESGTHQLLNESDAPATVLLLARSEHFDACYYPDSDKLLVDVKTPLEGRESIIVAAHPELDYFHGEC